MEGRIRKRIPVLLDGELITSSGNCNAIINNISKNGVYVKIPISEIEKSFPIDWKIFFLKLQLPNGDHVNLNCTKKWSYQISPGSMIEHIGIEVVAPPQQYKEYYKSCDISNGNSYL